MRSIRHFGVAAVWATLLLGSAALAQTGEDEVEIPPPPEEEAPKPAAPRAAPPPTRPAPPAPAPAVAPPAPAQPAPAPAVPEDEPFARPNRLCFSLGFGFGSAAMSRMHEGTDEIIAAWERVNLGNNLKVEEPPKSNLQINAELSFRYYLPYYLLAQAGYGALYNWASSGYQSTLGSGTVEGHNVIMEVPILVGGYYPLLRRLYLYGAVGPSIFFFSRSYWDATHIGLPDLETDSGVGFQALLGADFLVVSHVAFGLELTFRYLRTGDLSESDSGITITSGPLRLDASSETYQMDFTGISLALRMRFFVF